MIAYADEVKRDLLGVPARRWSRTARVSAETAEAMAAGARRAAGADVGVAVTGIAGPGGGSEAKPVGLVHFRRLDARGRARAPRGLPGRARHRARVGRDDGPQLVRLGALRHDP